MKKNTATAGTLRETTSFDVLIVKTGGGGLAVENRETKKITIAESLIPSCACSGGSKTPHRIVMKFCSEVGVPNVINQANFSDNRYRGFEDSGRSNFLLCIHWRYRASVYID